MCDRVPPEFLKWVFREVSFGNQGKQCYLFATFQDVEYRGSRGVSHQGQKLLSFCSGQTMQPRDKLNAVP